MSTLQIWRKDKTGRFRPIVNIKDIDYRAEGIQTDEISSVFGTKEKAREIMISLLAKSENLRVGEYMFSVYVGSKESKFRSPTKKLIGGSDGNRCFITREDINTYYF